MVVDFVVFQLNLVRVVDFVVDLSWHIKSVSLAKRVGGSSSASIQY